MAFLLVITLWMFSGLAGEISVLILSSLVRCGTCGCKWDSSMESSITECTIISAIAGPIIIIAILYSLYEDGYDTFSRCSCHKS